MRIAGSHIVGNDCYRRIPDGIGRMAAVASYPEPDLHTSKRSIQKRFAVDALLAAVIGLQPGRQLDAPAR
jgi:hypothetical protein